MRCEEDYLQDGTRREYCGINRLAYHYIFTWWYQHCSHHYRHYSRHWFWIWNLALTSQLSKTPHHPNHTRIGRWVCRLSSCKRIIRLLVGYNDKLVFVLINWRLQLDAHLGKMAMLFEGYQWRLGALPERMWIKNRNSVYCRLADLYRKLKDHWHKHQ